MTATVSHSLDSPGTKESARRGKLEAHADFMGDAFRPDTTVMRIASFGAHRRNKLAAARQSRLCM